MLRCNLGGPVYLRVVAQNSDFFLNTCKDMIWIVIIVLGISIFYPFFRPPIIYKKKIPVIIHVYGIILWEGCGLVQVSLVIYQYPVGYIITEFFSYN